MATSPKALFRSPCDFVRGVTKINDLPAPTYPEVVFCGRSNVGKSSLLNALTKRKQLARTSKTPGCTQQLNYFLLGEAIYLVDIPGYGFARASKSDIAFWDRLIKSYLKGRVSLSRAFLLIDSRHGVKKNDEAIMAILDEAAVPYQIILTKIDKQKESSLIQLKNDIAQMGSKHPALHPEILQTSSKDSMGLDEVRHAIASFIR